MKARLSIPRYLPAQCILFVLMLQTASGQQWERVHPDYPTDDITALVHWNGDTVFASGYNNMFERSTDGGAIFTSILKQSVAYSYLAAASDGRSILLLPSPSYFTTTEINDTTNIFLFSFDPASNEMRRISVPLPFAFSTGRLAVNLSANSKCIAVMPMRRPLKIALSTNHGTTWEIVTPPDSLGQYGNVHFRDRQHGLIVCNSVKDINYHAYITTDGGVTWTKVPDVSLPIYSYQPTWKLPFAWPSDSLIVLFSDGSTPYVSKDGGRTWKRKPYMAAMVRSCTFREDGSGYAIGENLEVFRTSDTCASWSSVRDPILTMNPNASICLTHAAASVIVAGEHGYMFRSNDGGVSWDDTRFSNLFYLSKLQFFNERDGLVSAYDRRGTTRIPDYYHTTDGGKTWPIKLSMPSSNWMYIHHVNKDIAYGYGSGSQTNDSIIFVTTNGGSSWKLSKKEQPGDSTYFFPVSGFYGRTRDTMFLMSRKGLLRTTDMGASWTLLTDVMRYAESLANPGVLCMDMRQKEYCWAITAHSFIRSGDNGQSWQHALVLPDSISEYLGFSIPSPRTIYIFAHAKYLPEPIGFRELLYKSTDNGNTWTSHLVEPFRCYGCAVFPSGRGFGDRNNDVSGDYYYRTDDEWRTSSISYYNQSLRSTITGYFFLDENTGWISGENYILHTSNGGVDWVKTIPVFAESPSITSNYPQPAKSGSIVTTEINSRTGSARLELYDVLGRLQQVLFEGEINDGRRAVRWSSEGAPGVYVLLLRDGESTASRTLVVR